MNPQKITDLAKLLRDNGDKILSSEFTLTLSGSMLRAMNDSFTLIADSTEIGGPHKFQVVKPINSTSPVFRDLQLVHDFVQKTALLSLISYTDDEDFEGVIDITKFRALKSLEVRKVRITQIVGIQPLRSQLEQLVCLRSLKSVDEVITHCGGDKANGFVWNELKFADFSYNNLQTVDNSLEFAQYLQHLNLRHNKLYSVEAIKWLPHLKTLDLSFNCLECIPQFHVEAYKRLQSLNISNNFIEDLMGISKLDALTDLDLSENCLLDHSCLLPLSTLMTLKFLNLQGNPLHCHPKHRMATAQFLHKNTATVRFLLDVEPLTNKEKSATGTHQMRIIGGYVNKHSTTAAISSGRSITPSSQTPASSVGSLRSFKLQESSSTQNHSKNRDNNSAAASKKRSLKVRTVNIQDDGDGHAKSEPPSLLLEKNKKSLLQTGKDTNKDLSNQMTESDHLETKKHIESLREKYGAEWLQKENATLIQSALGLESEDDKDVSRQQFKDFLGELSKSPTNSQHNDINARTSTPTNELLECSKLLSKENVFYSPNSQSSTDNRNASGISQATEYNSLNSTEQTVYNENDTEGQSCSATTNASNEYDDKSKILKEAYENAIFQEAEVSEGENDEETYIVYVDNLKDPIFLTISSNFIRERDPLTQRTKTKWSLKILESCDRMKSHKLRVNFDTVRSDKKERLYTVEDGLCEELERKLRDILAQRDLTEMNQIVYRCLNCTLQFCGEYKLGQVKSLVTNCPDCHSTFVVELYDSSKKSMEPAEGEVEAEVGVPVTGSVEEMKAPCNIVAATLSPNTNRESSEETQSSSIGSANSLVGSSSCSKITNSQSSFDSNQSVAGSSNTERNLDVPSNCESDVDILSNPSQSSIEVLMDQMQISSRKTSEERRISQIPNLETIDDHSSFSQSYNEKHITFVAAVGEAECNETDSSRKQSTTTKVEPKTFGLTQTALTESSSSGSVADSVCTAYEQNPLNAEKVNSRNVSKRHSTTTTPDAKEDSGKSATLGALYQSTDVLMSSSKKLSKGVEKLSDATGTIIPPSPDSTGNAQPDPNCSRPYKFNYTEFTDIDHRLKLYFYQTKFEKEDEHFKWLVRGRVFIDQTNTLQDGLVVMTTYKCYLMEAFAVAHDDVGKWLRQIVSVTVDRLESIQLLPWKLGVAFVLKGWGSFSLLLQDILRTDSLLLCFANNGVPPECKLNYNTVEHITKRLNSATDNEKPKMCSLLNGCEIVCGMAKRVLKVCCFLTTETRLYISSEKLSWLSTVSAAEAVDAESELQLCVTQLMSNLVEVERSGDNVVVINFLDETQDKCELWTCNFETKENADCCLHAISQSWEKIFGVPLLAS